MAHVLEDTEFEDEEDDLDEGRPVQRQRVGPAEYAQMSPDSRAAQYHAMQRLAKRGCQGRNARALGIGSLASPSPRPGTPACATPELEPPNVKTLHPDPPTAASPRSPTLSRFPHTRPHPHSRPSTNNSHRFGPASSMVLHMLVSELGRSSNPMVWLAAVGLTDQLVHERVKYEDYVKMAQKLQVEVNAKAGGGG
eukprot:scaffold5119_cov56-Isochrysis_galbana.AAC.1